jgi:hypothetical protein
MIYVKVKYATPYQMLVIYPESSLENLLSLNSFVDLVRYSMSLLNR